MALAIELVGVRDESLWLAGQSRAPRLRSMADFAEQSIMIPRGPYHGRRFRIDRQPFVRHLLREYDSGNWNRFFVLGCVQSGKTLNAYVLPILYHLFEFGEDVIAGIPDFSMAAKKWQEDILPAIIRSGFGELLPTKGAGSRGGDIERIEFRNGKKLTFMSYGGNDANRSGDTARVIVMTEIDKHDRASMTSRETDPIQQIEARARAFDERKRIYAECTVSTEEGRIWQEWLAGSASQVWLRCPLCHFFVLPEREHLLGWKEASTEAEARLSGAFACPHCAGLWTEADRQKANLDSILVHCGQTVNERGEVEGERPATRTLGFRWSAVHNLFVSAGTLAADEWRAARADLPEDQESREKALIQFSWVKPFVPQKTDMVSLTVKKILDRQNKVARGVIPDWTQALALGIDIGQRAGHWALIAWGAQARGHVVNYGVIEIQSDAFGVEPAILMALREFRDQVAKPGFGPGARLPDVVVIDSNFKPGPVRECAKESGAGWYASVGFGVTQRNYHHPQSKTGTVILIGEQYHLVRERQTGHRVLNINADHWKSFLHARWATPIDEPGALSLFAGEDANRHLSFAKHQTAERKIEQFFAGRGLVTGWDVINPNNHWLDASALACVGGHIEGIRLIAGGEQKKQPVSLSEWFGRK